MANIRTQVISSQRRIITKVISGQRRVSCSCCEEGECCMYPASLLGEAYTDADLPDYANGLQKNTPPVDAGNYGLVYYGDPNAITFGNQIVYLDGAWKEVIDFSIDLANECLFPAFEDSFADTYTAIGYDGVEFPINRTSLCVWSGSSFDGFYTFSAVLYYGGGGLGGFLAGDNLIWNLGVSVRGGQSGDSSKGIKADPHNEPIGTYTDPVSGEEFFVNP
jgi:hypothetical protein